MITWTEEQLMVRDAVRQFVEAEVAPRREELEFGDTPPYDVLRKLYSTFGMDTMARERFERQIAFEKSVEEAIAPAPDARYGGVVGIAMQYLGVPYVWGGASPSGFDCSGFSMYVYAQVGVSLPHHAASQYGLGSPVSKSDLQPGDLVFFNGLGHMGIYIGGGQFIHAPHSGDVVKISSLSDSWYARTWVGARRL